MDFTPDYSFEPYKCKHRRHQRQELIGIRNKIPIPDIVSIREKCSDNDTHCSYAVSRRIEISQITNSSANNKRTLLHQRRGFLHASGRSGDHCIRWSRSAGSRFPCSSQSFGSFVRMYRK